MQRRIPGPLPCAVLLAAMIALTGVGRDPRRHIEGARGDDRADDVIEGRVHGPVLVTPHGTGALVTTREAAVWVWSPSPIEAGQQIRATGPLRTPRGFHAPGSPDRALVVETRGARWELAASHVAIVADEPTRADRLWRWAARTQRTLVARIARHTYAPAARAALQGIVTGDRTGIPAALDARWRAVGIYHVLSVSGLHLAVVAGLAFALLRRLVAASPLGARSRPARWAAPAALVLAVAYTLVTGAQLATLRALIVVVVVLVAKMLDRPVRLVDALGVAAIGILAWRPQDVHDASFQLSFVAALTLALLPRRPGTGVRAWLVRGLVTSVWVAIATAPITAFHFQQVAAGGVVGNLLLTPVVELAALPLGLAGAACDIAALVDVAVWLVAQVDDIAAVIAHLMPVGTIALASPVAAVAIVAGTLVLCARTEGTRTVIAGCVVLALVWAAAAAPRPAAALRVTFLDVGQGDAAIIELPGGAVWLVDAGGIASARDIGRATSPGMAIARTLAVYGHDAIDLAVISHPHPDHFLGLGGLDVPIGELWYVADVHGSFGELVETLVARGTRVGRPALGALTTGDGVTLHVLAPRLAADDGGAPVLAADPVHSVNDNSLVIAIEYAGRTLLFTGDLEAEGEAALVAAGLSAVDVVKVPHHGSRTSSSQALVEATRPWLAVISCGVANAFGFPAPEVVARWRRVGTTVARTDRDGSVIVTVDATGGIRVARYTHASP